MRYGGGWGVQGGASRIMRCYYLVLLDLSRVDLVSQGSPAHLSGPWESLLFLFPAPHLVHRWVVQHLYTWPQPSLAFKPQWALACCIMDTIAADFIPLLPEQEIPAKINLKLPCTSEVLRNAESGARTEKSRNHPGSDTPTLSIIDERSYDRGEICALMIE